MATSRRRVTAPDLVRMKLRGERIAMLTSYDFTMARLLDRAGVDVLLVGDSLGMVVLGYDNTLAVTLDAVVHHTAAVSRGASRALVVADMPFLSCHTGVPDAVRAAGRLVREGGAQAVKVEGGHAVLEVVQRLVEAGIPVMGHLRPDAAVGPPARRISKAGAHAARRREAAGERSCAGGRGRVRDCIGSDSSRRRG